MTKQQMVWIWNSEKKKHPLLKTAEGVLRRFSLNLMTLPGGSRLSVLTAYDRPVVSGDLHERMVDKFFAALPESQLRLGRLVFEDDLDGTEPDGFLEHAFCGFFVFGAYPVAPMGVTLPGGAAPPVYDAHELFYWF